MDLVVNRKQHEVLGTTFKIKISKGQKNGKERRVQVKERVSGMAEQKEGEGMKNKAQVKKGLEYKGMRRLSSKRQMERE